MALSVNAACKRARRRGYKVRRTGDKITLTDQAGQEVLKDASPDQVAARLGSGNWYRDARITAAYADDMRNLHIPVHWDNIEWAYKHGLISDAKKERMIIALKGWDTRFKKHRAGCRI
jgi:hypothetical protein